MTRPKKILDMEKGGPFSSGRGNDVSNIDPVIEPSDVESEGVVTARNDEVIVKKSLT